MYSEADLADIGRRIGRCRAVLVPVIVLLGALVGLSLVKRWQAAAFVCAGLLAASAVFGIGYYLIPLQRYRAFLTDMDKGLSREMSGTVVSVAEEAQMQDGARVLPVHLRLSDGQDERIIYLNASKRELFPDAGARVHVRLCGRHIREVLE